MFFQFVLSLWRNIFSENMELEEWGEWHTQTYWARDSSSMPPKGRSPPRQRGPPESAPCHLTRQTCIHFIHNTSTCRWPWENSMSRERNRGFVVYELTLQVGFMSTEVEFDRLYLGQVAVLWVLVCVAVCPATWREQTTRPLVIRICNTIITCTSFLKTECLDDYLPQIMIATQAPSYNPVAFSDSCIAIAVWRIKCEAKQRRFFHLQALVWKAFTVICLDVGSRSWWPQVI